MAYDCSIIIPAYNAGERIRPLLMNILSYKPQRFQFEAIVVNDGSIDCTENIVKEFLDESQRIKLISKENGGVSSARNIGLSVATGQYIFFADADDNIHMDELEEMWNITRLVKTDLIIADYETVDYETNEKRIIRTGIPVGKTLGKDYIDKVIFKRFVLGENTGLSNLWNKLFNSKIIRSNELRFDENRTHGEDWDFIIRYIEKCRNIYALDRLVYSYVLDGSQQYAKYSKALGYCLLSGYKLTNSIKKWYNIILSHDQELQSKNRTAQQFIDYLKIGKVSSTEKRSFLREEIVRGVFSHMYHCNKSDLAKMQRSRKDALAFLLLRFGLYRIALKIL